MKRDDEWWLRGFGCMTAMRPPVPVPFGMERVPDSETKGRRRGT